MIDEKSRQITATMNENYKDNLTIGDAVSVQGLQWGAFEMHRILEGYEKVHVYRYAEAGGIIIAEKGKRNPLVMVTEEIIKNVSTDNHTLSSLYYLLEDIKFVGDHKIYKFKYIDGEGFTFSITGLFEYRDSEGPPFSITELKATLNPYTFQFEVSSTGGTPSDTIRLRAYAQMLESFTNALDKAVYVILHHIRGAYGLA